MGEFAIMIRWRAEKALREVCGQQATTEMDPVLELIGSLLEDGSGGILSTANVTLTNDEWLTWNQLVLEQEGELRQTMTELMEREGITLPSDQQAMRHWAAFLVLSTLDQLGML